MLQFLLNETLVEVDPPDGELVLDWLRRRRRLVGTKEGCKEGDCGACVVMLGQLRDPAAPELEVDYLPMTSCLLPMVELHGKHLVTIEGLQLGERQQPRLNPVQAALCEAGGSQCGFCTPGIVVSLSTLLTRGGTFSREEVAQALSGHLCRCTGYRSIKEAGEQCGRQVEPGDVAAQVAAGHLPPYFLEAGQVLAKIPPRPTPPRVGDAVQVAGGTDLYVQREDLAHRPIVALRERAELRGIQREEDHVLIGAATSFQELAESSALLELVPRLPTLMDEIASWQIRNRATVAGNLVNASPIGDITVLMLALDARLVLEREGQKRELPLRELYRGYKNLAKAPEEWVRAIKVPRVAGRVVHFEKVAKRRTLDIASVNAALAIDRDARGEIQSGAVALGGVAPIPLYLRKASRLLVGKPEPRLWADLLEAAQAEIAPISDIRGSADYKRLLVRQLLIALGAELFPNSLEISRFYAPEVLHG